MCTKHQKELTKDINNTVYIYTTPRHNKRVVHLTSDPRFKHYKVEMEKQVGGVTHRQCEFQSRLAHLGRRRSAGYLAQWLNICQRSPSRSERLRWMDSLVWPYHWSWQISGVGKEKKNRMKWNVNGEKSNKMLKNVWLTRMYHAQYPFGIINNVTRKAIMHTFWFPWQF